MEEEKNLEQLQAELKQAQDELMAKLREYADVKMGGDEDRIKDFMDNKIRVNPTELFYKFEDAEHPTPEDLKPRLAELEAEIDALHGKVISANEALVQYQLAHRDEPVEEQPETETAFRELFNAKFTPDQLEGKTKEQLAIELFEAEQAAKGTGIKFDHSKYVVEVGEDEIFILEPYQRQIVRAPKKDDKEKGGHEDKPEDEHDKPEGGRVEPDGESLDAKKDKLQKLEEEIAKAQTEATEQEAKVKEAEEEDARLRKELEDLTKEKDALLAEIAELEAKKEALEAEIAAAGATKGPKEDGDKDHEHDGEGEGDGSSKTEEEKVAEEKARVDALIAAKAAELAEINKKIAETAKRLEELKKQSDVSRSEVDKLRKELETLKGQRDALKAEIADLEAKRDALVGKKPEDPPKDKPGKDDGKGKDGGVGGTGKGDGEGEGEEPPKGKDDGEGKETGKPEEEKDKEGKDKKSKDTTGTVRVSGFFENIVLTVIMAIRRITGNELFGRKAEDRIVDRAVRKTLSDGVAKNKTDLKRAQEEAKRQAKAKAEEEAKKDGKPAEGKDGKPAEGKPAEGKPVEGKPAEEKPDEGKPVTTTVETMNVAWVMRKTREIREGVYKDSILEEIYNEEKGKVDALSPEEVKQIMESGDVPQLEFEGHQKPSAQACIFVHRLTERLYEEAVRTGMAIEDDEGAIPLEKLTPELFGRLAVAKGVKDVMGDEAKGKNPESGVEK